MLHNAGLTELSGLFVSSVIRQSLTKYTYSDQLNSKTIEDEIIRLPVDTSGEPDWAYMDEYMSAVMKEAEASLERLKQTDGEKHAVDASGWKEFKLTDIFRIKGKRIQIGAYAKSRVYVRISSYSSAYKMSEEDFEQPYYENHMN